jgi:alpha-2-macroglobulin
LGIAVHDNFFWRFLVLAISCLLVWNPVVLAGVQPSLTSPPQDETSTKLPQVEIELGEGQEKVEQAHPHKVVTPQPLSSERIRQILKRLPPAKEEQASGEFNIPPAPDPPPRPAEFVKLEFPSRQTAELPAASPVCEPLKVIRMSPEGLCSVVPQLSVTFSQAMVPVSAADSEVSAGTIPVKIKPQPPGKWHWLGTQTLVFQPEGGRFPKASEYQVEVPEGTTSSLGYKLDRNVTWTISTPAASVEKFFPANNSTGVQLSPVMLAVFDQRIDARHALKNIRLRDGRETYAVRMATEQEIRDDKTTATATKDVPEGQYVAFKSTRAFPKNQAVAIEIGPGMPSAEGPALGARQDFQFTTYGPLAIESHTTKPVPSDGGMGAWFNNDLDNKLFQESMVTVEPKVANLKITHAGRLVCAAGSFHANTKYTLRFAADTPDVFGQTLGSPKSLSITVRQSGPELIVPDNSGPDNALVVIPASKKPIFSFLSKNISQVKVTVFAANPADYTRFSKSRQDYRRRQGKADENTDSLPGFEAIANHVLSTRAPVDEYVESAIDLTPYMHNGRGNVILTVERLPRSKDDVRFAFWIQSTNIALDAVSDRSTLTAMVSRLDNGNPVSGAQIISPDGYVSTTDEHGLAKLDCCDSSTMVICKSAEDSALLWFDFSKARLKDSLRWYCVSDRNLYRPGERVHVKGWLRRFEAGPTGDIRLAASMVDRFEFNVLDAQKVELKKGVCNLDETGGFTFGFDLPKSCNLGPAWIMLNAAEIHAGTTCHFRIEEFRRPEFEMSVKSSAGNSLLLGESTNISAQASYFAGGPLQNSPVKWSVRTSSSSFAPPGWNTFSFGVKGQFFSRSRYWMDDLNSMWTPNLDSMWSPDPHKDKNAKELSYNSTTDSAGRHVLSLKLKSVVEPVPVSIVAEASVSDVNRQQWSQTQSILVHPSDVYVGVKSEKRCFRADEAINVQTVAVSLDGKALPEKSIHLELIKQCTERKNGSARTIDHRLCETDIFSESGPRNWRVDSSEGGILKIVATVLDGHGRRSRSEISFWKEERQLPPHSAVEKASVLLIPDRDKYQIGDTAELVVQAPFAASHGMVTLDHNGILSCFPVTLKESSSTIKIPIAENLIPNCHVRIDLVAAGCAFASGSTELKVPPDCRDLRIDVAPEQKTLTPGSKAKISFKVCNSSGKPASYAQLAVAVVDESALALGGYDWKDPCSVFYPRVNPRTRARHGREFVVRPINRWNRVPVSYPPTSPFGWRLHPIFRTDMHLPALAQLRLDSAGNANKRIQPMEGRSGTVGVPVDPRYGQSNEIGQLADYGPRLSGTGGAQENAISFRSNFSLLAYFNPNLVADSSGTVTCEFVLPDSLTRYRVMAIAAAGEHFFGKGESSITAKLPLSIRPSLPRFLNFGDRCQLPVVVQNLTDKEMKVEVALRSSNLSLGERVYLQANEVDACTGDISSLEHTAGGSVLVPANDRVELRFPATTILDGTAKVEFAAMSGENCDAAGVSFPVYTPATSHASAAYGQIDSGAVQQMIDIPDSVFDQIGGLELSTSSTALQSLTDAYVYLKDYGFSCSEQLASRVLAVSVLQDVLFAFGKMSEPELSQVKAKVQADIDELCRRQRADGSFCLWRLPETVSWPFLSIQVARALQLAQSKGYKVSEDVFKKTRAYLISIEDHIPPGDYSQKTRRSISAHALFVRYLMGDVDAGKAHRLIDQALKDSGSAEEKGSNSGNVVPPNLSKKDRLSKLLSFESMGWLLPVLSGDPEAAREADLLRAIIFANIRETAATAEVQSDSYGDYGYFLFHSPRRTDAVILEALILSEPKSDVIAKLASGLLAHRKAGRWASTQENSAALLALDRYFSTYEKATPDFRAKIWLGSLFVGEPRFAGRSTETKQLSVPMKFLQSHPAEKNILLEKDGTGRLYYRLALNYASKNLALPAAENGFALTRTYEAVDDPKDLSKDEKGVWHVKAGSTIRARLELFVPGSRYHVALTDPFAAGMEPVNTALQGFSESQKQARVEKAEVGNDSSGSLRSIWFPRWSQNWYEHENLRDFRSEAFSSVLRGGKYTYSYLLRATTPGNYLVPPAKVEEMYAPETFGRAASEHLVIE